MVKEEAAAEEEAEEEEGGEGEEKRSRHFLNTMPGGATFKQFHTVKS